MLLVHWITAATRGDRGSPADPALPLSWWARGLPTRKQRAANALYTFATCVIYKQNHRIVCRNRNAMYSVDSRRLATHTAHLSMAQCEDSSSARGRRDTFVQRLRNNDERIHGTGRFDGMEPKEHGVAGRSPRLLDRRLGLAGVCPGGPRVPPRPIAATIII